MLPSVVEYRSASSIEPLRDKAAPVLCSKCTFYGRSPLGCGLGGNTGDFTGRLLIWILIWWGQRKQPPYAVLNFLGASASTAASD